MNSTNDTTVESHSILNVANTISQDVWLYGWPGAHGSLSFAYANEFMVRLMNQTSFITQWSVEVGNVAD